MLMLGCCVCVFLCGWGLSRDAVADDLAELVLRHFLVVVHAAEGAVEDDEAVLRHVLEVQGECHPCVQFFIFYFSIKIENKPKNKRPRESAVKASGKGGTRAARGGAGVGGGVVFFCLF